MKKIIKLRNPIQINGNAVSEITVDPNKVTTELSVIADYQKRCTLGKTNVDLVPFEFDFGLYQFIGYAAAIAENPEYSFEDMKRVQGTDIVDFAEVGRNFLLKSEDAPSSNSGEQSETTPELSTQASLTSKENQ